VCAVALSVLLSFLFFLWVATKWRDLEDRVTDLDGEMRKANYLAKSAAQNVETLKNELEGTRGMFSAQLREAQAKYDRLRENLGTTMKDLVRDQGQRTDEVKASCQQAVSQAVDSLWGFLREQVRGDQEGLVKARAALLRGVTHSLTIALGDGALSENEREEWQRRLSALRTDLLATWPSEGEGSFAAWADDAPRPDDPSKELEWSLGRLEKLQGLTQDLNARRASLRDWFRAALPLWQEVEALVSAPGDSPSQLNMIAPELDRIVINWQYQTNLRLLHPQVGDKFNTDEMRKVGEALVGPGEEQGHVVALRRRGYAWGGRVLEPAAVVVGVKTLAGGRADA